MTYGSAVMIVCQVEQRLDELACLEDRIWAEERKSAENGEAVAAYIKGALDEIDDDLRAFRARVRSRREAADARDDAALRLAEEQAAAESDEEEQPLPVAHLVGIAGIAALQRDGRESGAASAASTVRGAEPREQLPSFATTGPGSANGPRLGSGTATDANAPARL
jgi:hypothetical protein